MMKTGVVCGNVLVKWVYEVLAFWGGWEIRKWCRFFTF